MYSKWKGFEQWPLNGKLQVTWQEEARASDGGMAGRGGGAREEISKLKQARPPAKQHLHRTRQS
jgi:hypothetical protein